MPNSPIVSVIIPNYNHEQFLKQRIDSILNQTYQNFELIILDDKSTDKSVETINLYAGNSKITHIYYNEVNSGNTFKQWKKGLQLASGKYIWIAESDDYADNELLETLMAAFSDHNDLILSYCQSIVVDENGTFVRLLDWADALHSTKWKKDYVEDSIFEVNNYLRFRNTIPNASAVVFKKPINEDILNESCNFKMAGDWVFWRKILNTNGKIAFFDKPLNYFRLHEHTTRAISTKKRELDRIKEFRKLVVPSLLNPFHEKYDWMIFTWFQNRNVLKGNLQYFIPFLSPSLIFRRFLIPFNNILRKTFRIFMQ